MDYESKMSNIAFGGNWSEELVFTRQLQEVLYDLEWAVEHCTERDVNTEAVQDSLRYVSAQIEKGPMLVDAFQRAMQIDIPPIRRDRMAKALDRIRTWAGI